MKTYYIGDNHPFVTSHADIITDMSAEQLLANQSDPKLRLKEDDQLIILCEMEDPENPNKRHELPGIKFGQRLRYEFHFRGKILFISFLTHKYLSKNVLFSIINTNGHSFCELPSLPTDWLVQLEMVEKLTTLGLQDISTNYCNKLGIASGIEHNMVQLLNRPNFFENLQTSIKQIYELSEVDNSKIIKEFEELKNATETEQLNFARTSCKNLLDNLSKTEEYRGEKLEAVQEYKVLILDDELLENSPLITELKTRGVIVKLVKSTEDGYSAFENELYVPETMVIVADYRLEEKINGISVHQKEQGYEFVKNISRKCRSVNRSISLFVYSGLRRKFLMNTFKEFSIDANIYSKQDNTGNDTAANSEFCDHIIESGNETFEAISKMPNTSGWSTGLDQYYYYLRNDREYKLQESAISKIANDWLEEFAILNLRGDIKSQNLEEKIKLVSTTTLDKVPGNPYTFTHKEGIPSSISSKNGYQYLIERRKCLWMIAHLGIDNGAKLAKVLYGEKANKNSVSYLGINPTFFPFGFTQEEYSWLAAHLDIILHDQLSDYIKTIQELTQIVQKFFIENPFAQQLLENCKFKIVQKYNMSEHLVYVSTLNYRPYVRNVDEIKVILNFINQHIVSTDDEFGPKLEAFIELIDELLRSKPIKDEINKRNKYRQVRKNIIDGIGSESNYEDDYEKNHLTSLEYFCNNISSHYPSAFKIEKFDSRESKKKKKKEETSKEIKAGKRKYFKFEAYFVEFNKKYEYSNPEVKKANKLATNKTTVSEKEITFTVNNYLFYYTSGTTILRYLKFEQNECTFEIVKDEPNNPVVYFHEEKSEIEEKFSVAYIHENKFFSDLEHEKEILRFPITPTYKKRKIQYLQEVSPWKLMRNKSSKSNEVFYTELKENLYQFVDMAFKDEYRRSSSDSVFGEIKKSLGVDYYNKPYWFVYNQAYNTKKEFHGCDIQIERDKLKVNCIFIGIFHYKWACGQYFQKKHEDVRNKKAAQLFEKVLSDIGESSDEKKDKLKEDGLYVDSLKYHMSSMGLNLVDFEENLDEIFDIGDEYDFENEFELI